MKSVTLTIGKEEVMQEVNKTTSYVGKKIDEAAKPVEGQNTTAYDRVRTTAATKELLERFWDEAASIATSRMMRFTTSTSNGSSYIANLFLTDRWNEALTQGMNDSLFSFFVAFIVSRWCRIADKEEEAAYMSDANAMLDDVMRKVYFRSSPTREGV